MADSISIEDAKATLAEAEAAEGEGSDLVKRLRASLAGRIEAADADAKELAEFRRNKIFSEAGIGTSPQEQLLRDSLANESDLTPEIVRQKAEQYGIASQAPSEPTVPASEIEALEVFNASVEQPPAVPPSLVDEIASAQSVEEIIAKGKAAGIGFENHNFA